MEVFKRTCLEIHGFDFRGNYFEIHLNTFLYFNIIWPVTIDLCPADENRTL